MASSKTEDLKNFVRPSMRTHMLTVAGDLKSSGDFHDGKSQSTATGLRSLAFLDLDHRAIELMWTPKETLVKLKNEDNHRYTAKILAGSKPAFDKKKMSRYWVEIWGKKHITLALE